VKSVQWFHIKTTGKDAYQLSLLKENLQGTKQDGLLLGCGQRGLDLRSGGIICDIFDVIQIIKVEISFLDSGRGRSGRS
jgi:hypothetical protein